MIRLAIVGCVALLGACSEKPPPMPPKRPNNELIIGEFERHPPVGTTAMRIRADGSVTVAHERKDLDRKNLAQGTWQLQGDQLTITYTSGEMCDAGATGTYKIVLSKIGIHWAKVEDACARRAKMDGETWYRAK